MDDRRNLAFLCATVGAAFIAITLIQPIVPLYAAAFGATNAGIGLIIALYSLLPLFLAVPAGMAVDTFGARRLMIIGSLGLAATSLATAIWPGLIVLTIAQTLQGLAQLAVIVAAQAYTASLTTRGGREGNFGWFATFASAGQFVGPLLGGALTDARGYGPAFLAAGCLAFLPAVLALGLGEKRPAPTALPAPAPRGAQIRRLFRDDVIRGSIVASFAVLFAMGARQAFLPLYLQGLGFSATIIGMLLSLRALFSMVVRPFMPALVRISGSRFAALTCSMAAAAAGVGAVPWLSGFWSLAVSSALVGIGIGLSQPLSMAVVADQTPAGERGLALGVRLTGNRLAQVVNPLFFGLVAQLFGIGPAFWAAGLLLAGTTALMFRWRSAFETVRASASAS